MSRIEFERIAERNWVPLQLAGDTKPDWMANIPTEITPRVMASGCFIDPRIVECEGITYSGVIGGLDIFRCDHKDLEKGYPINKDHYIIVIDPQNENTLLVHGPFRDNEHWLRNLPNLPDNIEVLYPEE